MLFQAASVSSNKVLSAIAVELMGAGLIDVKPLISDTLPFSAAAEAFDLASDRTKSMKVQLDFGQGGQ